MRARHLLVVATTCSIAAGCGVVDGESVAELGQATHFEREPIGLSLRIANGQTRPLQLFGNVQRYLQEIDVTESVQSPTDAGLTPLIQNSALRALDWRGIEQVEEIWVPSLDGSFTRERYFRGARWMEKSSELKLVALDARGRRLGAPWLAHAGRDDRFLPSDDGFVRRFVARQSAFGCSAIGNCATATFVAEALVQFRDALHPESDARTVPSSTATLRLTWDQLPALTFDVPVSRRPAGPFDYGFRVHLDTIGSPANGQYYLPGEAVSLRVTFRDGRGRRLHPEGQLPSYAEFIAGEIDSGLRYLDLQEQTRLYYALKHRESNLLAVLSGPTNDLKTPTTVVDPTLFFGPQVPFATTAVDGFTAVGQTVPPAGIVFGGFADPSLWELPVSDTVTLIIPSDAEAGTYVAAIKARRDFGGEALNRGATLEIQVGTAAASQFAPQTSCTSCHKPSKLTGFDRILHGVSDRRACFGCHASLGIEPDNALDIRVHTIHDRSDRFDVDIARCSTCHLSPPAGPARGVLP
ncbi:MAG TPA: hypothetical protein VJN18_19840 [Polyangiaceae bacterium]|nr:hypothetical protein [Polyangiaceae bacterium]